MKFKLKARILQISIVVFTVCLTSCSTEKIGEEVPNSTVIEDQPTTLIPKYFMGEKVMVRDEEDGTYSISGSDIRVFAAQLSDTPNPSSIDDLETPPDVTKTNKAAAAGINKWPNNTVVYVIKGLSATVRTELQKSMDEWSSKTNIRFKERTNETNYVTISSSGSNSNSGIATLGMFRSSGFIRLGTRATAVVIIHEIGHTLGYIHEQNRSDRDAYIRINFNNIQDNAKDQFFKDFNANLITKQFDVNSIMMYGSYTFSKNRLPTITDLNGNTLARRQARLSPLDIQGANAFYPSSNTDPETTGPCDRVSEWRSGVRYFVGDRVTYRGYLFERQFNGWSRITTCD